VKEGSGFLGSPLHPARPWQFSSWGEARSSGGFGDRADPPPGPGSAPHTPPFHQGDARAGDSGEEPWQRGAPLSPSRCCTGVGNESERLKGLLYTLLLHKLEHDSALH